MSTTAIDDNYLPATLVYVFIIATTSGLVLKNLANGASLRPRQFVGIQTLPGYKQIDTFGPDEEYEFR